MSRVKIEAPVHLPAVKEYKISGQELRRKYESLGIEIPFPIQYWWYFHSDIDGWAKIIPYLVLKSSLYKPDKRTCSWYSFKAYTLCNELFRRRR